jgi:hypothetical protein
MKKDKPFRDACMASTYFNPSGVETLLDVNNRYGQPFKLPTLYRHMTKHQAADIQISEKLLEVRGVKSPNWQRATTRARSNKPAEVAPIETLENTVAVVGDSTKSEAEIKVDEFLAIAEEKLKLGHIPISATNYTAALKIKADIEMRKKDRKLDMLKSMFAGAAPKHEEQP